MFSRHLRNIFIATLILTTSACREATMPEEPATSPAFARNSNKGSGLTPPKSLIVTGVTSYTVSLDWEPSTAASIVEYRVRVDRGSVYYRVPSTQTSFHWKDALYPGQNYTFWVIAVDAAGNQSANSNTVSVSTPADVQPPTAPALSVAQLGHSYVVLNWPSTDESPKLAYQIKQNGVVILKGHALGGFNESTTGTAIFLQPSTTYTFTATARDLVGNLSQTSQLVATTKARDPNEVTPPSTPTNVSAYPIDGVRELWVTWTQSTDNVDPQAVIMYEIFLNGVLDDVQVGRDGSTVYGVVGENKLTVVAIDANGNRSAPSSFTLFLQ
jgi:hypothetical protein